VRYYSGNITYLLFMSYFFINLMQNFSLVTAVLMENVNPGPRKSLLFLYFELQSEIIFTQILYHMHLESFFQNK